MALIGLAVYLGFLVYGDAEGGRVGSVLYDGLEWLSGAAIVVAPVAIALCGAALVARPLLPAPAALNAGAILLGAGILLAFAAQTAGLGPTRPIRHGADAYFDADFMRAHGGGVGEALYWAAATLFQRVGAHVIAGVLIACGVVLISGRSIYSVGEAILAALRRGREALAERQARRAEERAYAEPSDDQIDRADRRADEGLVERLARLLGHRPTPTESVEQGLAEPSQPLDGAAASDEDPLRYVVDDAKPAPDLAGEDAADGDGGEIEPPEPIVAPEAADQPAPIALARTPMGTPRGVTASDEINYILPSPKLLRRGPTETGPGRRDHEPVARALLETLGHFGIEAKLVGIVSGPHVSRFELQLAPGTKVAKISQLKDDLAYALASTDIRILAPIPGKRAVGVEVPNARRRMVRLGDVYAAPPKGSSPLLAWLGRDITGEAAHADLALMPHILVAGTTGSGKSGCVNAILSSLIMHSSPNQLRLVLVDPKRVELNHYEILPHLLTPVVTNPRLAANVLANLIGEMENRYAVMGEARARNLVELNKVRSRNGDAPLPHILCVIDELADLMMVAPSEVEDSIIRLAQKSRAVGIHLVLATQRPSTDIITGTIKVNIPARIAFAVSSQVDSRVILDSGGAESLLGQGDMLFRGAGTSKLARIQGAFVTEEEIAKIVNHWGKQGEPDFDPELLSTPEAGEDARAGEDEFDPDEDDLLEEAIRLVVATQTASVSGVQRRLRVGYTRAGRLIDMLERRGVISGYEGSKPRQVLIGEADIPRVLALSSDSPGGIGLGLEAASDRADSPTEGDLEALTH